MKKIFTSVLLVLLLCLSACADNTPDSQESANDSSVTDESQTASNTDTPSAFLLASSEIQNNFGKIKSDFEYNENGLLVKQSAFSNGNLYLTETTEYDENGFVIKKQQTMFDNSGNTIRVSATTYVNSATGLVQSGTVDISGAVNTFSYTYDDQNRVLEYKQIDDKGNAIQHDKYSYLDDFGSYLLTALNNNTTKVVYDKDGNKLENTTTNGSGTVLQSILNEYDSHNNVVKDTDKNGSVTIYENTYENNFLMQSKLVIDGELISSIEYQYDEYGNVILKKQLNASGSLESSTVNVWTPVYTD